MYFKQIEAAITKRMQERNLHQLVITDFIKRVQKVHAGDTGKVTWDHIKDLNQSDYFQLQSDAADLSQADWNKLAVIKLNGGLGTSMGLSGPKSIIKVRDQYSFLDIIREQTLALRKQQNIHLPLLLMNSFNTREASLATQGMASINADLPGQIPADFVQNMVPRLAQESLKPFGATDQEDYWCPPGHGDIFLALQISGALDRMLAAGYRVAFISNGDNLGALVSPAILKMFLDDGLDWASEVTPKTRADLKGGVLYRHGQSGRIELLETAQVPQENIKDFQDINRFSYFNINNLWVQLESLRDRLKAGSLDLALIVNPKELEGQPILQLEVAMGAAVGHFDRSRVVVVPRTRFAPVKSCADLFVRRSDACTLDIDSYALRLNPARQFGEPVIVLDDHYKKINDFEKLVPVMPSLLDLEHLEIKGPILFDRPVKLKGTVKLKHTADQPRSITEFLNADDHEILNNTERTL